VCETALTTGAPGVAEDIVLDVDVETEAEFAALAAGWLCAARLDTPATSTANRQSFLTVSSI